MKINKILIMDRMSDKRRGFETLTSRFVAGDHFPNIWWMPVGIRDGRGNGMFS